MNIAEKADISDGDVEVGLYRNRLFNVKTAAREHNMPIARRYDILAVGGHERVSAEGNFCRNSRFTGNFLPKNILAGRSLFGLNYIGNNLVFAYRND